VLGLRDILDTPETVAKEWGTPRLLELIPDYYDRVLVYGEQALFDPIAAYRFPREVAARTRFCGYVVNRESNQPNGAAELSPAQSENGMHPVVVATTGGGEDGFFLLETFIRAASGSGWQAIVIAGPMTPEPQLQKLKSLANEHGVVLRTFVPRLSSLFGSIDALVCMGGYNTLIEAVSTGVPTVCVPRTSPRMEQYLRASAFENHGLLRMVRPSELNPERLRGQIELALKTSRQKLLHRSNSLLSFEGAHQAAAELLSLIAESPLRRERSDAVPSPTRAVSSPVYAV
jgi:predicted glycosyltransferase